MRWAILLFTSLWVLLPMSCRQSSSVARPAATETPVAFSEEELQRRTFLYFWELADTVYWQIPDRWPTLTFSSIAATGFGLTSYICLLYTSPSPRD